MSNLVLSSSSLTGDTIVNLEGEKLGTVEDLMIDTADGNVMYAVLSRGGVMGVGNKLFAVPWQLLSVDTENERLVLDVEEDVLDSSPGFDHDNWPKFADSGWQSDLRAHYEGAMSRRPTGSPPLT